MKITEKQLKFEHLVLKTKGTHDPEGYKRTLFNCLFYAIAKKDRLQKRMAARRLLSIFDKEGITPEEGQKQLEDYIKELNDKHKAAE